MSNRTANWLVRRKAIVLMLTFLCGLMLAEAPTVVRQEGPADLSTQRSSMSIANSSSAPVTTLAAIVR